MADTQQTMSSQQYDDELDLRELFRVLWAGKWLISGFMFVAAVISVIIALMLPNVYRADALLAPNDHGGAGGLSALAAQYGGLASLAGINLPGGAMDKTALGIEVLRSRKFISEFIERHDILVPLIAAVGWDAKLDKIKINSDDYDVAADKWVRDVSFPKKTIPSLQEAYEKFIESFSASQDKKSGFVTISVEHYSPSLAKQWVDWLVLDVNTMVMEQDVAKAEQAIAYLNEQIKSTSLADLQNVFFGLIEEQTKTVMLAKVSPEYLFRTLDPAVAPELKARPNRLLIVIMSMLIGAMAGVLFALIRGRVANSS